MTILIRHKKSARPASISVETDCFLNHDLMLYFISTRISLVHSTNIIDLSASLHFA